MCERRNNLRLNCCDDLSTHHAVAPCESATRKQGMASEGEPKGGSPAVPPAYGGGDRDSISSRAVSAPRMAEPSFHHGARAPPQQRRQHRDSGVIHVPGRILATLQRKFWDSNKVQYPRILATVHRKLSRNTTRRLAHRKIGGPPPTTAVSASSSCWV